MIELKAYVCGGWSCDKEAYPKDEVDKVIAEKDAEIARLNAIRKVHVEAIVSMEAGLLQDDKEIRHLKYKRCLAMAKSCEYRFMNLEKMINTEYRTKKMRLSQRWWRIWLKLADKFKEAK